MDDRQRHVVGVGAAAVTSDKTQVLVTYSLGSCVGLTLFDPRAGVGAMLHAQLPLSSASPEQAREAPTMFVDSGVVYILERIFAMGATRGSIVACVAGAALSAAENDVFQIGRRNHSIVRKILWKNDILISAEDVGGRVARTLMLDIASGRTTLRVAGHDRDLYPAQ
jgi:chemotaxis protein CheD